MKKQNNTNRTRSRSPRVRVSKKLASAGLAVASIVMLAVPEQASAQQVTWQILREAQSTDFALSDGTSMADGFQFELGYFQSFDHDSNPATPDEATPTSENISLWDANWQSVDAQALGGGLVSATTGILSAPNVPIFVWGFSDMADIAGEHLLLTNPTDTDWLFPTAAGPAISISALDAGTEAIYGAVVTATGTSVGGGVISSDAFGPAGGGFAHVQSATMAPPVPEPGSAALAGLAAILLAGSRRRPRRP